MTAIIEFAKRTLPRDLSLDGLRVVIDCAHGAGYKVCRKRCGNWAPTSSPSASSRMVSTSTRNAARPRRRRSPGRFARCAPISASRSTAMPDRVILVDERGHIVDGDQLLAVIAQSWKEDGRLARPGIVATVMSNLGLERFLSGHRSGDGADAGRRPLCARADAGPGLQSRWRTVRPYHPVRLRHHWRRLRCRTAGASCGAKTPRPVSEVCHRFDPLPQILKNVRYRSGKPLDDAEVKSAIVDGEKRLNGHGRLLVRSSGTEPVIRVMGEGDDRILVEEVVDHIVHALGQAAA